MLAILMLLAALYTGSTCFVSNARAYLCTASIASEASAANKHRKPSTPPPPGPPKPGQHAKPMKVTRITYIEPPINRGQRVRFQDEEVKEVKEVKEVTLYQALEGCGRRRHYYNKTEEEVKARKEYRRDKL